MTAAKLVSIEELPADVVHKSAYVVRSSDAIRIIEEHTDAATQQLRAEIKRLRDFALFMRGVAAAQQAMNDKAPHWLDRCENALGVYVNEPEPEQQGKSTKQD